MIKKYTLLLIFLFIFKQTNAQIVQLSVYAKVSVVTVGPGEKLYEKFGHSAIRIKDPVLNFDYIYNYGMFDFKAPNFYSNFTKGKLTYKLAAYPFKYFEEGYKQDKRWIKEQEINLTKTQKQEIFTYLYINAKPENANYEYDPFFENCATKMPDIISKIVGNKVSYSENFASKDLSFRQLMNKEIHWNTWGNLGINVALGSKLDKVATAREYTYLPDYVYKSFKKGTTFIENQPEPLVKNETTIIDFKEIESKGDFISPILILSIVLLIGFFITLKDLRNKTRTKWLDFLLFFTTGIIGLLVVFLWFFTNHSTTPNNFNFLWAFAPNLIIAFYLLKKNPPNWILNYIKLLFILLVIMPLIWLFKIQLFALSLIPFLLLLVIRYFFLQKKLLSFHK